MKQDVYLPGEWEVPVDHNDSAHMFGVINRGACVWENPDKEPGQGAQDCFGLGEHDDNEWWLVR